MVKLSLPAFVVIRRYKKFLDSVRILAKGGTGGNGYPKYGGHGGKGGDVYVQAAEDYDLKKTLVFYPNRRAIADAGEESKSYQILGRPGKNAVVYVPTGVTVVQDNGQVLGDLNKPGDRVMVACGGAGGNPSNQFYGQKGFSQSVTLDLKLIADVGLVGFPNAGKSTMLKALSRADPKIANYPFTTIEPNVGIMSYEDKRKISLADLPGLIEGAHLNFGMGHNFLKHVMRTDLILFVVDVCGFKLNPFSPQRTAFETIMLLNRELELYNRDLVDKPALLVLNKMDIKGADKLLQNCMDQLDSVKTKISDLPEEICPTELVCFDKILPVSGRRATNIADLKQQIRISLDLNHKLNNKGRVSTYISSVEAKRIGSR